MRLGKIESTKLQARAHNASNQTNKSNIFDDSLWSSPILATTHLNHDERNEYWSEAISKVGQAEGWASHANRREQVRRRSSKFGRSKRGVHDGEK